MNDQRSEQKAARRDGEGKSILMLTQSMVAPRDAMELFHVSPAENRESILSLGLEPRVQEHQSIKRSPKVFLFEYREEAEDNAFWSALETRRPMDVWIVQIHDDAALEQDQHIEMTKDFNSWMWSKTIAPLDLSLAMTVPIPLRAAEHPPFVRRRQSQINARRLGQGHAQ